MTYSDDIFIEVSFMIYFLKTEGLKWEYVTKMLYHLQSGFKFVTEQINYFSPIKYMINWVAADTDVGACVEWIIRRARMFSTLMFLSTFD